MADSPAVRFAHLTDIHIRAEGHSWGSLGRAAVDVFEKVIERFNQDAALDFVLITGDVFDEATEPEVTLFVETIAQLEKPWHYVPGNHDGFISPRVPDALPAEEVVRRIDPRMADEPFANHSQWTREIAPGLHLIGLDSRLPDDWLGEINPGQLSWLEAQLDALRDDLVLIAVHHPLDKMGPHNDREWWEDFILQNGSEVEALLDRHPNVKLVLSGHHHVHQLRQRGPRLHINTAPLSGYPCVYRLVTVTPQGQQDAHIQIETVAAAEGELRELAHRLLLESDTAWKYNPDDLDQWVTFCSGSPDDQSYEGVL
ncbi:MAG: hypothetical protein GYB68_17390 [Chloroflexi bacterium]|nr:hypothetical protein [Chloroflexota bacterium]